MPEFILDTSGQVDGVQTDPQALPYARRWRDLDPLARGYIEALFFTDCEHGTVREAEDDFSRVWNPETDSSLPGDVGFSDLDAASLAAIIADCRAFEAKAADLLEEAYAADYDAEQAGRDFWFTRNGHGVGFWDRRELETYDSAEYERLTSEILRNRNNPDARESAIAKREALESESLGKRLSAVAESFGAVDSCFGDDGRVHL